MAARSRRIRFVAAAIVVLSVAATTFGQKATRYDVVVYGGTSAGVTAAVQSAKLGKSVVLIEPGRHIGGLTSGGLGATDIGNKAAIGGLSRDFYESIGKHYMRTSSWKWQKRSAYRSRRQRPGDKAMWTFEPHVAEKILRQDAGRAQKIQVVFNERLDLKNGVRKTRHADRCSITDGISGRTFRGKVFIDCHLRRRPDG